MMRAVSLPPAAAIGALYDGMLQSALRRFFARATVDAEPAGATSDGALLAIEPSANPAALMICWFGTRYTLRVPGRWPFTAHEVRLARAIGDVLAARYRAILNPQLIAERSDLFQGLIEDRYVGSFLDHRAYAIEPRTARADLIASVIELLRVAALSSYENRIISTGVLLLSSLDDPFRPMATAKPRAPTYSESLTSIRSFYRLADGVSTVFLANSDGRLLDIIDLDRWSHDRHLLRPWQVGVPLPRLINNHQGMCPDVAFRMPLRFLFAADQRLQFGKEPVHDAEVERQGEADRRAARLQEQLADLTPDAFRRKVVQWNRSAQGGGGVFERELETCRELDGAQHSQAVVAERRKVHGPQDSGLEVRTAVAWILVGVCERVPGDRVDREIAPPRRLSDGHRGIADHVEGFMSAPAL